MRASFEAELGDEGLAMPALEHLIYASVVAGAFALVEPGELVDQVRAANGAAGLTGMLLHSEMVRRREGRSER